MGYADAYEHIRVKYIFHQKTKTSTKGKLLLSLYLKGPNVVAWGRAVV